MLKQATATGSVTHRRSVVLHVLVKNNSHRLKDNSAEDHKHDMVIYNNNKGLFQQPYDIHSDNTSEKENLEKPKLIVPLVYENPSACNVTD